MSKTGDPAAITGMVHTTVALAGIQGEVHSYSPSGIPLWVQSMEPIGLAAGMHLTWEPTATGARFVLFADQGAPLPPTSARRPTQFLRIQWLPGIRNTRDPGIIDPSTRWHVAWNDLFGSDIDGNLVPLCPLGTPGIVADVANICVGGPGLCDMNGDAQADVRDLVLMAHCLVSPRACPWDLTNLDCDGDTDVDFDDLYCCARTVLGVPPCPTCGDSVRVESGIALRFSTPQRGTGVIEVPMRIDGAGLIGAARLTLAMPPGLAGTATLDLQDSHWLRVTRANGDRLEVGLIGIPSNGLDRQPLPLYLEATLRITLPGGSDASGQIALEGVDLSGPDGVKLKADLGSPVVRLGPGLGISLSQARPNPFGASTAFRLTLDAPADAADLAVYDLSGRRITTIHKGPLPIGSHAFTWDGRMEAGGRARAGVFFVRASVAGHTSIQKLVMLRD
ncbi:MAG TPA: FlgD immunoglobulin-like domain containing protein [Gemmatimonadales bacterium]|nr:FlgD immunoglobulin-like domain containing protein [Gemmatimonadales bacterium]